MRTSTISTSSMTFITFVGFFIFILTFWAVTFTFEFISQISTFRTSSTFFFRRTSTFSTRTMTWFTDSIIIVHFSWTNFITRTVIETIWIVTGSTLSVISGTGTSVTWMVTFDTHSSFSISEISLWTIDHTLKICSWLSMVTFSTIVTFSIGGSITSFTGWTTMFATTTIVVWIT